MPGFLAFGKTHHWAVIPIVKQGCTAITYSIGASLEKKACLAWLRWAIKTISALHPTAIAIATEYSGDALGGDPTAIRASAAGLRREAFDLANRSRKLMIIEDDPTVRVTPVDCLLKHGATLGSCTFPLNTNYADNLDVEAKFTASITHAAFIPTLQWFCSESKCPMVVGNTIVTIDGGHLTTTYAEELARPFAKAIATATHRR